MKKSLLLLLILISTYSNGQNLWKQENESRITTLAKMDRKSVPTVYNIYSLDLNTLKGALQNAPLDTSKQKSDIILSFPISDGNFDDFNIYNAPVMEKGLSLKYPGIESYTGISVTNPSTSIRFSITVFGLHAMISSPSGTSYIDTFTKDLNNYIVYKRQNISSNSTFTCDFESDETLKNVTNLSPSLTAARSSAGNFRIYRLAMACTIEYAAFHVNAAGLNSGTLAQKKAAVLSAMVITMTRVNFVFEKDMALRMTLVANNDLVIFIDSDNFNNTTAGTLINQSQTEIDAAIGSANYDIGHTVSTGGGGLAQLYSPCSGNKARGITGQGSPVGDPFDIDYVAHEMGHQWGGNHTQNNNCNRSAAACVEPGSASTIMGYAGICSPNVQNNSDAYFHTVSITEMQNFIAGSGGTCGSSTINTNATPVANAGLDYTIPNETAYILKGAATDADSGDVLTYCWEQVNNQVSTQPPTTTATTGPNFRSLSPSLSADRYMPVLSSVVAGNLAPTWEVISNTARTMNFALTVRDNSILNGAQTSRDDMVLTVANVGPFLVTSPNTSVSYASGTNQTVTWDVAGTTANGINCANVDIYLSTDGGFTYPITLATNVANDGSETITVPDNPGTTNRIMVKGFNHIFYDISNANFTITQSLTDYSIASQTGTSIQTCKGIDVSSDIQYTTYSGFSANTTFTASGQPAGATVAFSPNPISTTGLVTMTISNTNAATAGNYTITATATSGAIVKSINYSFQLFDSNFAAVNLTSPANFASSQPTSFNLTWDADANATSYDVEVATDVDFTSIIVNQNTITNSYLLSGLLETTNYFWRITPKNSSCSGTFSETYRFTTGIVPCSNFSSTDVPITISASGTPTVSSTLTVPTVNNVTISDINVTVNISHTYTQDLTVTLISPNATEIDLVVNQCGSNNNILATFDDAGTTLACATNPAISGTITPTEPLSTFNGQNSEGVWTLRVVDNANADGGAINSWSLTICSDPVPLTCGQITTTWNGTTWSNGIPQNNVAVTIDGNFTSTSNLSMCSLDIIGNSQVTISSGNNLEVENAININSTSNLTIENNANLIQINDVANTGNAVVQRNSNTLMRLDYTIWSSPLTSSQTLLDFSPNTLIGRFYSYNTSSNIYQSIPPTGQLFENGKGYLIRMPDNHPTTSTVWNGEFNNGILNNGSISSALTYNSSTQNFNLIGNPYPSTINADDFITNNTSSIFGTLYFWRKINNAAGTAYATYTLGGATTTSPTSPTPNGTIQIGQGFFVQAKNIGNPTATFTNDIRVKNNQNQFFRTDTQTEKNRIWLNLTNNDGLFHQTMIGYMTDATNGYDDQIDGKYINDNSTALSSLLNEEEYTIQLNELPFNDDDVFPMSFKSNADGNYSIAIDHIDGLFETSNQIIYLKDNLLQAVHNLSNGAYSFSTNEGIFDNRFEIVFREQALSNIQFDQSSVIIYSNNNQISIDSGLIEMSTITIYDTLGRMINTFSNTNTNQWNTSIIPIRNQALLVKIRLSNGLIVTKKIMH